MRTLPKRVRPERGRRAQVGSERDLRVLGEIGWAAMLTSGQVERLAFPSRRRAQRRLRVLLDQGLVRAHLQAEAMHRDNVWTLTKTGIHFLADRGVDVTGLRAACPNVRSQKLRHALLVRDLAVSFLVGERRALFRLLDFRLDEELASAPVMREAGIIPDGFARLESGGETRTVLFEVASDSQPHAQVRAKVAAYDTASAAGPAFFRDPALLILVAVEREARLQRLREEASRLPSAARFRFAALGDVSDPERLVATLALERETATFAPVLP